MWIFSALLDMGLGVGATASGAAALGIFGLFAGTTAISVGAATGSPAAARGLRPAGALAVLGVAAVLAVAGGVVFARRDLT